MCQQIRGLPLSWAALHTCDTPKPAMVGGGKVLSWAHRSERGAAIAAVDAFLPRWVARRRLDVSWQQRTGQQAPSAGWLPDQVPPQPANGGDPFPHTELSKRMGSQTTGCSLV